MGKLHIKAKTAALFLTGLILCGCKAETGSLTESSSINIIDAGGGNFDETTEQPHIETNTASDLSGTDFNESSDTTAAEPFPEKPDAPVSSHENTSAVNTTKTQTTQTTITTQTTNVPFPPFETILAPAISEETIETLPIPTESETAATELTEQTEQPETTEWSEPTEPPESTEPPEQTEQHETVEPESTTAAETDIPIETEPPQPPAPVSPVFTQNTYTALNYSDVKGVWISYIELSEMLKGKSETEFKNAINAAFDNIVDFGLNTVYVHVRSHGDAYYESELFPWSKYSSGILGVSPGFDPLEIMLGAAHERALSFQAWINPLRGCGTTELSGQRGYPISDWANSIDTAGRYVVPVDGTYYLNPAYGEVIEYITDGAAEICSKYDVDGVHIDDYFYPTTDSSFDNSAYESSEFETISAFRFANCDNLVSSLYWAVKSANPSALFGVSCQGSVANNYNLLYADVKKWCSESGYLDYICPQIYYGFKNSTQPYEACVSGWDAIASVGGIPMIAGLSVSKVGNEDIWAGEGRNEWVTDTNILARQLNYAKELPSFGGVCLYSYRNLFIPDSSVKDKTEEEKTALRSVL